MKQLRPLIDYQANKLMTELEKVRLHPDLLTAIKTVIENYKLLIDEK